MYQTLKEAGEKKAVIPIWWLSAHSVEFDPLQLIGFRLSTQSKPIYQVVLSFVHAEKPPHPLLTGGISTPKAFETGLLPFGPLGCSASRFAGLHKILSLLISSFCFWAILNVCSV